MPYNEELATRIREILKAEKGLSEKKMFGGVGFLVRGNLACGAHKDELILRLGETDFRTALKTAHARIFDMTGRPMKGWILVAKDGYKSEKVLQGWIRKSLEFARSLPPK